jgi:hypothetical protein
LGNLPSGADIAFIIVIILLYPIVDRRPISSVLVFIGIAATALPPTPVFETALLFNLSIRLHRPSGIARFSGWHAYSSMFTVLYLRDIPL